MTAGGFKHDALLSNAFVCNVAETYIFPNLTINMLQHMHVTNFVSLHDSCDG